MAGRNVCASPPPHIYGSNNGSGGCRGVPCLLPSLVAAAVQGQCHGDNADNGNDDRNYSNDGVHSNGSEHGDGSGGNGAVDGGNGNRHGNNNGAPPHLPPPSLPM